MGTSDVPSYATNYVANTNLDKVNYNYAKLVGNAYASLKIIEGLTYRFNVGAEVSFRLWQGSTLRWNLEICEPDATHERK